ncbi:lysine transporter [Paraphotobacterium marinum]|uniref:Lysine transporter n=1 Tax=Paraphotobacterium marinum TaxID=1755811 RepID=A0A220VGQ1_9GAMM|nr:amino acid permease [Paraphotobacterium marinum]ASK79537.1 lysine transporter [Paraphotobacterium marinum]
MENIGLKRNLKARHLNMIALGGSIGTGIFLGSGYALHVAGPAGAVLAYALLSIMVYFLITSLGEMATFRPTSGSFCEYSTDYVGPSFGFAMGINYWFNWAITIAAEISAAAIIMKFWFPDISPILISSLIFLLVLFFNVFSVKIFGETEYILSFIKVAVIITFIILAFALVVSKPSLASQNIFTADGPFHQGFYGFMSVFLIAGFSFQGCELIGISAGETKDPQKSIPKAVRSVFWRLILFYILATALIGLLIPFNDPKLFIQDSVESSPFTLIFMKFFGQGLATNFINLVILIAVISAANASMYASTRTLFSMGQKSQAPKIFAKTNKYGLPIYALIATALVGSAFLLSAFSKNENIFSTLLTISALCGFIAWFGIALSHFKFRKSIGEDKVNNLKYKSKFYPIAPLLAMIFIVIIIAGQITQFDLNLINILENYGALIIFIALIIIHKIFSKR